MTPEAPLVLAIGEILVEIMATEPGLGFREPVGLVGPYPSGAPAIFIDQAARQGAAAAMIGAVGADDFGRMTVDRLRADGVDVSGIGTDPDRPTGTAFVRYRPDGGRDFVFNIVHSAAAQVARIPATEALVARAGHLHVTGTALVAESFRDLIRDAARRIKGAGGTLSLDPNLRPELLGAPGAAEAVADVLALTDILLPSGDELLLLAPAEGPAEAAAALLARGVGEVVLKRGARGAVRFGPEGTAEVAGHRVEEVDPTGAGDCFGATYVAARLRGEAPGRALALANAAGALAVTRRGPMEGASTRREAEALL